MRKAFVVCAVLFLGIGRPGLAQNPTVAPPPPALPSLLNSGAPVTGAPGLGVPGIGALKIGAPNTGAPNAGAPKIAVPNTGAPRASAPETRSPDIDPASGAAGRSFMSQAQSYMNSGRLPEAKESLRTAIRLEPMNLEAWALYDNVVETLYLGQSREDKRNPFLEGNLVPNFSIDSVESYMEFGTLYLIGELRNVSTELRRHVEIQGVLMDENRQEIRRETTTLPLADRGMFPGEKRLFEIRFRSPPNKVKSYRVRVSGFE